MNSASSSYEEREELRASLRSFVARFSTEEDVRRLMATEDGFDADLWKRMAGELGLQGFAVPEEFGGSGFSLADHQIVLEEMGRALMCGPYFSSAVLATNVLLAAEDSSMCYEILPELCEGSTVATVAALGPEGRWDGADVWTTTAATDGNRWQLSGQKSFVPDALIADFIIVTASTADGPALFLVDAEASGLERYPLTTLDETRKQGTVMLASTPARLIGMAGAGEAVLEHSLARSAVALAGEHCGGARRALELAVEYARVREQFGRVIGSFQAIKQKCADVLLAVEAATSAARAAAGAFDANSPEQNALAHLALGRACEAYVFAVNENIEVHGGIGFTWEASAHLYYKRAIAGTPALGSAAGHRAAMLTTMGR